jgi:hypothetical protein
MRFLQVSQVVPVSSENAFTHFWDVNLLQQFWTAITQVGTSYDDGSNQECTMSVIRNGKQEDIRIVRFRSQGDILFFNPQPPPMMAFHRGAWRFQPHFSGGCLVVAQREYQLRQQDGETDEAYERRAQDFHRSFESRLDKLLTSFEQYCSQLAD